MNLLVFVVLIVIIAIMILQNFRLIKRSKHIKKYIVCSDAIFDKNEQTIELIDTYINDEEDEEFKNKGRVLLIYALLRYKDYERAINEANKLDLKMTFISNKGKFDQKKFEYNSDTYFWMILALIKAHTEGQLEVANLLVDKINEHYEFIRQDLVVDLFLNIHHTLANDDQKNINYLRDVWSGNYAGNPTYDKQLIGFYKYLAVSVLAYLKEVLGEEMIIDLKNFAKMKAGRVVMEDLGILEVYKEAEEVEESEEVEGNFELNEAQDDLEVTEVEDIKESEVDDTTKKEEE